MKFVFGITGYAGHLPSWRLQAAAVRAFLGEGGGSGERSVAGHDEDSTTLAVAAVRGLGSVRQEGPLVFATTAPAYADKSNAVTVAAAAGLAETVEPVDVGLSLRGGLSALLLGLRSGGTAVAADLRSGQPGSVEEASGGDAAAAFACGPVEDALALPIGVASTALEIMDRWREPGSATGASWDDRFSIGPLTDAALATAERALAQAETTSPDHVVVATANPRLAARLRARLGDERGAALERSIGYSGAAHAPLLLTDALDRAAPGDTILVLGVADGADALVLRVTDAVADRRSPFPLSSQIENRAEIDYGRFLTWRGQLSRVSPRRPEPQASAAPPSLRSAAWKFALVAARCTGCETVSAPPVRICPSCRGTGMESYPVAERRAKIISHTVDRLAYSPSPPVLLAVVDIDGGGRLSCEVTDALPEELAVGAELEFTFRRLGTVDGIHNYFWKTRPVRDHREGR